MSRKALREKLQALVNEYGEDVVQDVLDALINEAFAKKFKREYAERQKYEIEQGRLEQPIFYSPKGDKE